MATAAEYPRTGARMANLPGCRFDHAFFTNMALVMLVTVFVGFAHTYYLAGLFRAPLPNRIIHIHGAIAINSRRPLGPLSICATLIKTLSSALLR
jgi:hypothetical protein